MLALAHFELFTRCNLNPFCLCGHRRCTPRERFSPATERGQSPGLRQHDGY